MPQLYWLAVLCVLVRGASSLSVFSDATWIQAQVRAQHIACAFICSGSTPADLLLGGHSLSSWETSPLSRREAKVKGSHAFRCRARSRRPVPARWARTVVMAPTEALMYVCYLPTYPLRLYVQGAMHLKQHTTEVPFEAQTSFCDLTSDKSQAHVAS